MILNTRGHILCRVLIVYQERIFQHFVFRLQLFHPDSFPLCRLNLFGIQNPFQARVLLCKNLKTGNLNARKRPMGSYEEIMIFYKNPPVYNPQRIPRTYQQPSGNKKNSKTSNYGRQREDYIDLIKAENEEKSEGTLFTYILDKSQEKERIISSIAKEFNMTRYECMPKYETSYLSIKRHPEESVYPSVTRWLRSIYDAELVVTDSFHGTAFSIIFNKPFYVILNINRGADRFISLLNLFGLEDRIISGTSEISNNPIDWNRVNKIREEWEDKSLKFLVDALK